MQVKCLPYGGVNPTMTVYYAQNGDAELTLYKEIATISTIDRKIYEFNEEGISADYWVVRFTSSGWIDLRLCSPSGLFTTGLYTEEFHQQIMDRLNGYQPVGDYQPKGDYVTTDTAQATLSIINSQIDTNEENILSLTQSVATLEDTSKKREVRLGKVEQQIPQLTLSIGNLEAKVDENTQSIASLTEKTDKIADDVGHIPRIYTGETIREGQRKDDFFILEETGG
mgnify:CR=1 FL=1